MKLNFCTLFNTAYLAKGIALYESLQQQCASFHLYIVAFDAKTYQILTELAYPDATIISLDQLENKELLAVKPGRSVAEYCWTCTPATVRYCIDNYNLDNCTYLDADLYFYSDPTTLIHDMGESSVLITPHNYHPAYDQSAAAGIYCVQFVTFKNTVDGNIVLNWWLQACLNWCYARYEDGKMGDQKYLDSWPYMFNGIYICRNAEAGLAPWNALNYKYSEHNDNLGVDGNKLVFYHFHDLKYLSDGRWFLGGYDLPGDVIEKVYKPYLARLESIDKTIKQQYPGTDSLNALDVQQVTALSSKYKLGIYKMDLKKSARQFFSDVFFASKRKYYQKNYIKID
ncbi:glycosyl transferase [Mucilaginibacter terrenus]|uniref:glycosyl transferase n=1 Tax=Mucilaginibacter terrenus TaxID=2482727 RepID=UPI00197B9347|nr:glycosyl transferase [Mucilaginibacter terrenus]